MGRKQTEFAFVIILYALVFSWFIYVRESDTFVLGNIGGVLVAAYGLRAIENPPGKQ